MKITIKKLEKITGHKIRKNFVSIGFDTATRLGLAILTSDSKYVIIDTAFIEFEKGKVNSRQKYKQMVEAFAEIISEKTDMNVIEDTYLQFFGPAKFAQAQVFKELTRYGGFLISESIRKKVPYEIIGASSARSKLKIKTTGYGRGNSKLAVADWLKKNLDIKLDDHDISDAIVLAILGLCIDMDFKATTKKVRKKRASSKKQKD